MPGVTIPSPRINYKNLFDRMKDYRIRRNQLSFAIGVDYGALWRNIRAGKPLDGRIILAMCPILNIQPSEIGHFFFTASGRLRIK